MIDRTRRSARQSLIDTLLASRTAARIYNRTGCTQDNAGRIRYDPCSAAGACCIFPRRWCATLRARCARSVRRPQGEVHSRRRILRICLTQIAYENLIACKTGDLQHERFAGTNVRRQLRSDLLAENLDEIHAVLRSKHGRGEQIADADLRLQNRDGNAQVERGDEVEICERIDSRHTLRGDVDEVFAFFG